MHNIFIYAFCVILTSDCMLIEYGHHVIAFVPMLQSYSATASNLILSLTENLVIALWTQAGFHALYSYLANSLNWCCLL